MGRSLPPLARWSVVLLALAGAACFALSVVAGAWWSVGPVEIGPHGARQCFGGADHCGLQWIGASARWPTIGIGTWGAGLVAALGLVVIAAGVAGKRTPRLLAKMTISAVLLALGLGSAFYVGFPGLVGASVDRGLLLFGLGIALGVAAPALIVARVPR
ncbi:MAG: hypothetical protein NT062_02445 [Proteobacteria bacterium]|nr:hypothetical protein [Pseudomonadota bacterium]